MSMVFINEDNRVMLIHNQPQLLSEEERAKGYEVLEVLERPETGIGEQAVRYFNPKEGQIYWKIKERPLTEEERLQQQEESLDDLWESYLIAEGVIESE